MKDKVTFASKNVSMYKEYSPNILLSPYIETYWVTNDSIQGEQTIRILPDGCVDILFNWDSTRFIPQIIGTITTYLDVMVSLFTA